MIHCFDFSYVFPENQYISTSDTNISVSDDSVWASDTEEISYTFTSDLNDGLLILQTTHQEILFKGDLRNH